MLNKILWYLPFYRLKIFKISNKKLNRKYNQNKFVLIYINHAVDIKTIELNESLKDKVVYLNHLEFDDWFEKNKKRETKYLFVSHQNHCLFEYRKIRHQGYKAYILSK